jgi:Tol biopolymer transport system component
MRAMIGLGVLGLGTVAPAAFAAPQQTTRVSVTSTEQERSLPSESPSISADGRYVAFTSAAAFAGSPTKKSVYVRDRAIGITELVSVDSAGVAGDGSSFSPAISADGRFVAFTSFATNLVANDANGDRDVFVHDRATGITERVSVDSSGAEATKGGGSPSISADGRYVAFGSFSSDLVTGDANGWEDVFVRDRVNGTTIRASVDSAGLESDEASSFAAISADGAFVAFESLATNLVAGDDNDHWDVFVHELQTGTTTRVSISTSGEEANDDSYLPSLSADGRCVVFSSRAKNLVTGDTNKKADVFLHDRHDGTTTRVSVDSAGGQLALYSDVSSISGDGNVVAFRSRPVTDPSARIDVWRHDRTTGATTLVSVAPSGQPADGSSETWLGCLSFDGSAIAFTSHATDLVDDDGNDVQDVFVRAPWLTLTVVPDEVASGAAIELTAFTGRAAGLFALAAVELNGGPMFLVLALGTFDPDGAWSLADTVPAGLSGNIVTLQAFGIVDSGRVAASRGVPLTFH